MSAGLRDRLLSGFADAFGNSPAMIARAPGRVNLIGEHTDYNDGFALPVAIGAETQVALRPRTDDMIRIAALDLGTSDSWAAAERPPRVTGWRNYVRGMIAVLHDAAIISGGADIAIAGDVPKGTGLSSSASLEVAVGTAILAATGREREPRQLALWAQAAENDFVGMRCGNLDQLAAAATQSDAALLIDCRSLVLTPVSMPRDAAVMIVQSGVVRGLLDGEYNLRRAQCEEAARTIGVPALRDADLVQLEAAAGAMSEAAFRRARHVITENARTLAAARALAGGDLALVGRLMKEAHISQRDDFEITTPETDRLAELMSQAIGECGGARQTGGGFGGAIVGLLPAKRVADVAAAISEGYRTPDGAAPDVRVERPAAGATVEHVSAAGGG